MKLKQLIYYGNHVIIEFVISFTIGN